MIKDPILRIRMLAQSFPGLWNAPGVSPWDAVALDEWPPATFQRESFANDCGVTSTIPSVS